MCLFSPDHAFMSSGSAIVTYAARIVGGVARRSPGGAFPCCGAETSARESPPVASLRIPPPYPESGASASVRAVCHRVDDAPWWLYKGAVREVFDASLRDFQHAVRAA